MIAATLFSGIGAPETAMPEWRWLWAAEIEPFPSAVLAARHPETVNLGDVTDDDFTERAAAIGRPDVLVFGSPCQSFSVAGKRLGLDDARGNLALVALGIARRLKPRWIVFENVPGLLSSADGRDFGLFLRAVEEAGYSGAWSVLDAQWFGLAQRRQRVFFVGRLGADWRGPAAVLLEPESLCGDHPPRRGEGQGVARPIAASSPGGSGCRNDADTADNLIAHALTAGGFDASEDGTGRGTPLVAFGGNDTRGPIDVATARNAHGGPHGRLDFESETFVVGTMPSAGGTERKHGHGWGQQEWEAGYVQAVAGAQVRRLMPVECEALQGFPRSYTDIHYRGKPAADGPRYAALGNSMAVPVVRWILTRLEIVDRFLEGETDA